MAVYKSALPVRHENIGDLTITMAGSDNTTILDILTINSAYGATPNVIPIAGKYEDVPTTYDDGDAVPLLVDASGRLQVVADTELRTSFDYVDDTIFNTQSDSVIANGLLYDDVSTDNVQEHDIGIARMTADRIALVNIDDGTDRLSVLKDGDSYVASTGGLLVFGQNLSTDYQALKVDSLGALYVNSGTPGTLAEDAGTINCVKDTPVTVVSHTPAAPEEIRGVTYGGSGKAQVDIYYGVTSSEVRKHTFYTSSANPNIQHTFPAEIALTSSDTIYVQVTNLEKVASPVSDFSGYATISYVTV